MAYPSSSTSVVWTIPNNPLGDAPFADPFQLRLMYASIGAPPLRVRAMRDDEFTNLLIVPCGRHTSSKIESPIDDPVAIPRRHASG
jgi:hypothetical protein